MITPARGRSEGPFHIHRSRFLGGPPPCLRDRIIDARLELAGNASDVADEHRWRRAHAIAEQHPGVDVGGIYRVLRNLEKTPTERLRDGLRHGKLFPRSPKVTGMHVLDLASGRGEPALRAARRVGPTGKVVGVDISQAMLDIASDRAARDSITNFELRAGDAESLENVEPTTFDAATCRWGLITKTGQSDWGQPISTLVN